LSVSYSQNVNSVWTLIVLLLLLLFGEGLKFPRHCRLHTLLWGVWLVQVST